MQYQKDTKKSKDNSYGHNGPLPSNALANKSIFEFVNKKTEKLVTALYMVTDCMYEGDALKSKIRILGVELLSDMYKIETLSPIDKQSHITRSLGHVHEVLSFVDIACTIGFISDMNGSILKRELLILRDELKGTQSESTRFNFSLEDKMFDIPMPKIVQNSSRDFHRSVQGHHSIKDISSSKRTYDMSFTKPSTSMPLIKNYQSAVSSPIDKQERSNKILTLIKDTPKDMNGLSIKDISVAFTDCSEKTIQRELNSLVSKGQIKKLGAKRWSRYQSL